MKIRKILKSEYKIEEIKESLDSVTETYNSLSKYNSLFEGKVDESEFQISPIFDKGNHKEGKIWNQFKIEMNGKLIKNESSTLIILHFYLPQFIKTPLLLLLSIIILFNIYLYFNPINPVFTGINLTIGIFFNLSLFYLAYFLRIKRIIKILCKLLKAEIKK